jgi:hypothetical protein
MVALSTAATVVLDTITAGWPVDTGLSLAGFRREPRGDSWWVYNDVEYTEYVHGGLADRLAAQGIAKARPIATAEYESTIARRGTGRGFGTLQRNTRFGGGPPAPTPALIAQQTARREVLSVVASLPSTPAVTPALTQQLGALASVGRYTEVARRLRAAGLVEQALRVERATAIARQAA